MDIGRSAYSVDMQFDEAGTIVRRVRWYFAADTAKDFPGPHLFGSSNWLTQSQPALGIGERWDSVRKWSNGQRPAGALGTGKVCGNPDWFRDGCPSDAPPLTVTPTGLAACCAGNPGLLIGGTSSRVKKFIRPASGGLLIGGTADTGCMPFFQPPTAQLSLDNATWLDPSAESAGHYEWNFAPPTGFLVTLDADTPACPPYGTRGTLRVCHPTLYPLCEPAKLINYSPPTDRAVVSVPMLVRFRFGPVFWIRWRLASRPAYGGLLLGADRSLWPSHWLSTGGLLIGGTTARVEPLAPVGGLLIGGTAAKILPHLEVSGGLRIGGNAAPHYAQVGSGGLRIGGTSHLIDSSGRTGGLRIGGSAAKVATDHATGGLKIGGTYGHGFKDHSSGGLKIGGTSADRLKPATRTGGLKIGGTATQSRCVVTSCCPGVCISENLNVYRADGTFVQVATYDETNKRWPFSDNPMGCGGWLNCAAGSPGTWQINAGVSHCTVSRTVFSLHCAHPFRVDLQSCWSGALCVLDGTCCRYVFSEGAF